MWTSLGWLEPHRIAAVATESKRLIILALLANVGIAITKFVAAFISGSAAMLAEAFHSVADTGNQLFLLRGHAVSRYAANVTHPFGRGKAMYFWSFMVAVVLFVGGAVLSIFNGWQRITHPVHESEGLIFSLVVLAISAAFEIGVALVPALWSVMTPLGAGGHQAATRDEDDPR